jgi:hypothetical protein
MAKVEIDETELATYRQVFTAVRQGLANPKTRAKLLEVQAELTPEATSPEITLRSSLDAFKTEILGEFSKFREETVKEKTDREERDSRDRLNARWAESQNAARGEGYKGDALDALEKFMEEKGVADHRVAIPAFERLHPPAQPVTTGGQRWDFFGAKETRPPDLKALLEGDEDAFLAQAIPEALASVRNQR